MAFDLKLVRHALKTARDRNYSTVEVESGDLSFSARLTKAKTAVVAQGQASESTPIGPFELEVKSTWVGYFSHVTPAVEVGQRIEADTVVGSVQVLGIPNELVAGVAGIVEDVLVADGEAVQYGQGLFRVQPV